MAILTRIKINLKHKTSTRTLIRPMCTSLTFWTQWDKLDLKGQALARTVLKEQILNFNFSDKGSQTISKVNSLVLLAKPGNKWLLLNRNRSHLSLRWSN